jgi:ABC-type bacteriocin/lantibiotic exporter with double-glycine peptidase domain
MKYIFSNSEFLSKKWQTKMEKEIKNFVCYKKHVLLGNCDRDYISVVSLCDVIILINGWFHVEKQQMPHGQHFQFNLLLRAVSR